ncbi:hypothetical protein BDA96_03G145300 [Sorghum bicolor]|uniref:Uncharacterized protein n=1 Tax=Sorghum bicolor TaxID=4558 RepID=A0A921UMP6_SORBI|nr:hypothetical protein BDA96_03G145300 [Sorghum bicolor]
MMCSFLSYLAGLQNKGLSGARCGDLEDQRFPFPLASASKQGGSSDLGQALCSSWVP